MHWLTCLNMFPSLVLDWCSIKKKLGKCRGKRAFYRPPFCLLLAGISAISSARGRHFLQVLDTTRHHHHHQQASDIRIQRDGVVVVVAQLATVSGTLRSGRFNNLTGPAANGNRVEKPQPRSNQEKSKLLSGDQDWWDVTASHTE